jgi:hypothetical protein
MSYDPANYGEHTPAQYLPGEDFEMSNSWSIEDFDDIVPVHGDDPEPGLQL